MHARTVAQIALITLVFTGAGCGNRVDYRERYVKLQAEHRKEIAKLEAMYTAQIEGYKQKLASREKELRAQSSEMGKTRKLLSAQKMRPATSMFSAGELKREKAPLTALQHGAQPGGPVESSAAGNLAIPKNISTLEQFVSQYENSVSEAQRERYQKDFGAFLAQLRAQAQNEPVQRKKERTMGNLRERINTETDEDEKSLLENRLAKIESAGPEDLEGTLNYYQQLDNNLELNRLMDVYNISRDELREYGIAPPPRINWGPELKEITNNLSAFAENYAPLVPEEQRAQYQKDISDLMTNMTTIPTDAQVIQRKNQMMADLKSRYATAADDEKQRLERRIQRLETTDLDDMRRRMQMESTRTIRDIADKYSIPRSELQESGVRVPWRRRGR